MHAPHRRPSRKLGRLGAQQPSPSIDPSFDGFQASGVGSKDEELSAVQEELRLMRHDVRRTSGPIARMQPVLQLCPRKRYREWVNDWTATWAAQGLPPAASSMFRIKRFHVAFMLIPFVFDGELFDGSAYPPTVSGVVQGSMLLVPGSEHLVAAHAFQLWVSGQRKVHPARLAPLVVETLRPDGGSELRIEDFGEKWDLAAAKVPPTRSRMT